MMHYIPIFVPPAREPGEEADAYLARVIREVTYWANEAVAPAIIAMQRGHTVERRSEEPLITSN